MTAIPHLNLKNLDEYSQSKAYQIEQIQSQRNEISQINPFPKILNKLSVSSIKVENTAKPIKRTYDEMQGNISPISSIPQKSPQKLKPISRISNEAIKICRAELDSNFKSEDQKNKIVNTCEIKEDPKGKLLALLEVNAAQYKKLLSVINTNSNVVVIDNNENDLNILDDNGKRFFIKFSRIRFIFNSFFILILFNSHGSRN